MKSKEEILEENVLLINLSEDFTSKSYNVFTAMDSFAKQIAIEFIKFSVNHTWKKMFIEGEADNSQPEQLFELFKKENNL